MAALSVAPGWSPGWQHRAEPAAPSLFLDPAMGAQCSKEQRWDQGSELPPEPRWILGTKKPAFETRQNCPALCKAEAAGSTN